jgi:glutamine synthetase type III
LAAQISIPPEPNGPDLAAVIFYKWYLGQLVQNKDPLHDAVTEMKRQVATPLLREIEKEINSADGMDVDYFIAAQDYLDDWPTHVTATVRELKGAAATVQVQLGASTLKPYRLRVGLIKEKGDWKIRKVNRL